RAEARAEEGKRRGRAVRRRIRRRRRHPRRRVRRGGGRRVGRGRCPGSGPGGGGTMRVAWLGWLAVAAMGCATDQEPEVGGLGMAPRAADGTIIDDRSLCDWKNKPDIEVNETAGPGAIHSNVRRVYRVIGIGPDRRKILICREI